MTLATRLALTTGLGFLALAAALVLASSHHFLRAHEDAIGREQARLAASAAAGVEDALALARRSLERTAATAPIGALANPLAGLDFLERRAAGLPGLFEDGLALLDASGRVVAASWPATRLVTAAGALEVPPVEPGRLVSAPYAAASDRTRPAVAMRAPVRSADGAVLGWIHGGIDLHAPAYLGALARSRVGERGFVGVVTPQRVVALHPDAARVLGPALPPGEHPVLDAGLAGRAGFGVVRIPALGEVIAAADRVPSTGWAIVAHYPLEEARAPILRARTTFLAAALAAAAALLLAVLLLTRRLTRPLAAMTAQVEALAEGRDVRPVEVDARNDEVGTLAAAFNRLLEQRGRAEASERASEERHRFTVQSVPVVQWATDREGVFTSSEGRGLATLGLEPGEVVGRKVTDVYREYPGIVANWERAAAGETFSAVDAIGPVTFETHWGPLRDDAGAIVGVTGIALDVTDRLRAETARKASELRAGMLERLAATGQLAAGVAHEINNPLTYVLASLDDALERLRAGAAPREVADHLAEARDGAERVRSIVRDLRVFARADDEERGACDAAAVARSAAHLVANEIRHRARLVTRFDRAPPAAIAERRLAQVLVNLLVNACQAIPEGRAAENEIRIAIREEGGRVLVEVADTGAGMTDEVRRRIFEPFFTTRPVGEGMGLGLAMSHGMVTEAGGELEVESAPGQGATFRIRLPAAPAAVPEAAAPPPASRGPAPAERLRVLLVDDEPLVGRAVARVLRGFDVDVETSAAGALERVRSGVRYDAVVCDLMMPDATGMDLHARVAEEDAAAAARFVFLTGGAFTDRARAFVATTSAPVLEKPIDPAALRAAVSAAARAGER